MYGPREKENTLDSIKAYFGLPVLLTSVVSHPGCSGGRPHSVDMLVSVPAGPMNQPDQWLVFIVDKKHAPSPLPAAVKVLISSRTCRTLEQV